MRKVLMSEEMFQELGGSRVDWGTPDADGFYTPTVYRNSGHVIPETASDERAHVLDTDCWCSPTVTHYRPVLVGSGK